MPAERLREKPVDIGMYDVAGQDSDNVIEFVRHVGLTLRPCEGLTRDSSQVLLVHMGPPLTLDDDDTGDAVQTVATARLTVDEIRQVGMFIDEVDFEYRAERARPKRQYIIAPHTVEPDEHIPFRRFSCAGFAIEAYRDAGIDLLCTTEDSLPPVSLDTLKQAYPDQAHRLDNALVREKYGVPGEGPWPVVLAGYVINAMVRDANDIRSNLYTPVSGDEFFPRRLEEATSSEQQESEGAEP